MNKPWNGVKLVLPATVTSFLTDYRDEGSLRQGHTVPSRRGGVRTSLNMFAVLLISSFIADGLTHRCAALTSRGTRFSSGLSRLIDVVTLCFNFLHESCVAHVGPFFLELSHDLFNLLSPPLCGSDCPRAAQLRLRGRQACCTLRSAPFSLVTSILYTFF